MIASAFSVNGSQVAFAVPTDEHVEIRLKSLPDAESRLLSTIPRTSEDVTVNSMGFDGRWVVWSDNRDDQFDIYATDTATGTLRRLTTNPSSDTQVSIDDGRVVFARGGSVFLADLSSGTERVLGGSGLAPTPKIQGNIAVWGSMNGTSFWITARELDGERPVAIARDDGLRLVQPVLGGGWLAWTAIPVNDQASSPGPAGESRIQMAAVPDLLGGEGRSQRLVDITDGLTAAMHPAAGGQWLAWMETTFEQETQLAVLNVQTGLRFNVSAPASTASISDAYIVVAHQESDGAMLYAMSWKDAPQWAAPSSGSILDNPLLVGGGLLLVVGLGLSLLSSRKPQDGDDPDRS